MNSNQRRRSKRKRALNSALFLTLRVEAGQKANDTNHVLVTFDPRCRKFFSGVEGMSPMMCFISFHEVANLSRDDYDEVVNDDGWMGWWLCGRNDTRVIMMITKTTMMMMTTIAVVVLVKRTVMLMKKLMSVC